jgi:DedD protein
MAYEFSLDRKATVTLSASSLVLIILVFVAGILTGVTWQSNQDLAALRKLPASVPKATAVIQPPAPQQSAPAAPPSPAAAIAATPGPAPTPAASPGPPEPIAAEPAATATSAAAPQSAQVAASVPNLQLAVQVGAFLERANADKLAAQLKEEGYSPQIVQNGHAPKQWNFVRVGPYQDWDEAAEIASVLSRDLPTPAVVRPMQ